MVSRSIRDDSINRHSPCNLAAYLIVLKAILYRRVSVLCMRTAMRRRAIDTVLASKSYVWLEAIALRLEAIAIKGFSFLLLVLSGLLTEVWLDAWLKSGCCFF